jgi:peptidoglycan-N-acetylglucosamine deacetylase
MRIWVYVLTATGTVYMVVPWILTRVLGIGVIRKGEGAHQVALTFDDGPNPLYTPRLLDLLRKHQVKATFFVLGAKAEQYPELIRRMHQEGHQIGIHNYRHTNNWLMLPWRVRRQVSRAAAEIEAITGEQPTCYRPPWGIFNICDLLFMRKQYTFVLWSLMTRDWKSHVGRTALRYKLLHRIRDGSIVVLHDCGKTPGADHDAPAHMLHALEEVLPELDNRNIRCVKIEEMLAS